jgi:hypothetical protein
MTGRFEPCPHCARPLAFLEGAAGASMNPKCPSCGAVVSVSRSTFLMADHSRPAGARAERAKSS